jgi:hypothetical protein
MTTACVRTSGQSCASDDEGFGRNRVVQAGDTLRFLVAFFGRWEIHWPGTRSGSTYAREIGGAFIRGIRFEYVV